MYVDVDLDASSIQILQKLAIVLHCIVLYCLTLVIDVALALLVEVKCSFEKRST